MPDLYRGRYMTTRVAIVGAGGGVGSSTAFNLLVRDEPYDIAMVDGRSGMAASHEMDLQQVVAAGGRGSVRIVELAAIGAADVVVVSAAVPLTVNRSRLVYLRENAAILDSVTAALPAGWPGVLIVVTNPVDVLCTWIAGRATLAPGRVLGYTANDSLRLRTAVSAALGCAATDVDAWVLGEHGDHCVPLLDRVAVAGTPVRLDRAQRRTAQAFVRDWYLHHVALDSGRSSTWATGHGVARMVAAVTAGDDALWPASVVLDGEYGITGASITVPVTLGPGGVQRVHEWDLAPAELSGLRDAAAAVSAAAASL
jgi:malate dehydrogenase